MVEERGIYRGEVLAIMGALADISTDTDLILTILEGGDEDDEAEEMDA
ncbi:MAG: hypothetical protein H0V84_02805 [Actinobacteria bacterium]|nr:hypothetical protein [Actinomycetota bacterium]